MTIEANPNPDESTFMTKIWDYFSTDKRKVGHESTPLLQPTEKPKTLYYLAYGSNLSSSTFLGRRGIRPLSATNVLCPGQILVFDLDGIPYWEPCFANIREVPQDEQVKLQQRIAAAGSPEQVVREYMTELENLAASGNGEIWKNALIGVVYEVTEEDFATIIRTEGGGAGYKNVEVDCYVLPSVSEKGVSGPVTTIRANTLRAPPKIANLNSVSQPSPRYLNLLVTGAKEHSLPPTYIHYLSSLHGYRRTNTMQKIGGALFLAQWMIPILSFFNLKKLFQPGKTGESPPWIQRLEAKLWVTLWFSYRWMYKPIWGDGERTIGDDTDLDGKAVGDSGKHTVDMGVDTLDLGDALVDVEEAVVKAVMKEV